MRNRRTRASRLAGARRSDRDASRDRAETPRAGSACAIERALDIARRPARDGGVLAAARRSRFKPTRRRIHPGSGARARSSRAGLSPPTRRECLRAGAGGRSCWLLRLLLVTRDRRDSLVRRRVLPPIPSPGSRRTGVSTASALAPRSRDDDAVPATPSRARSARASTGGHPPVALERRVDRARGPPGSSARPSPAPSAPSLARRAPRRARLRAPCARSRRAPAAPPSAGFACARAERTPSRRAAGRRSAQAGGGVGARRRRRRRRRVPRRVQTHVRLERLAPRPPSEIRPRGGGRAHALGGGIAWSAASRQARVGRASPGEWDDDEATAPTGRSPPAPSSGRWRRGTRRRSRVMLGAPGGEAR